MQTRDRRVRAISKNDRIVRGTTVAVRIAGISIEVVCSQNNTVTVFDQQILLKSHPESVAGHNNSATGLQMNVALHIAQDISGNRNVAFPECFSIRSGIAATDDPDVGRSGRRIVVLDRASGNCHFSRPVTTSIAIDQHVCRGLGRRAHVAFKIAARNVNIPDISTPRHNSPTIVVTDVTTNDVRLMQIHLIVEDTNSTVLVNVTVREDHVPVVFYKMNSVTQASGVDPGER